jgi:hypothetical protein
LDLKPQQSFASSALRVLFHAPWWTLAVYTVVALGIYEIVATWPWRPPVVITPSWLDHIIPLVPAASYPYMTYVLLPPTLIVVSGRRPDFVYVFGAGMACHFLNLIAYTVVPSELSGRAIAPAGSLLELLYAADGGRCVLPSGHAALPVAVSTAALLVARSSAASQRFWRGVALLFALWGAMLATTALLTKQHYVVDIIAGAVFGALCAIGAFTALRMQETRWGGAVR